MFKKLIESIYICFGMLIVMGIGAVMSLFLFLRIFYILFFTIYESIKLLLIKLFNK